MLDRVLLLTSDDSGFLQVTGHARDTIQELAMTAGALGTLCNKVRDCAAGWKQSISDPRIAIANDDSFTQIGFGAGICGFPPDNVAQIPLKPLSIQRNDAKGSAT